MSQDNPYAPPIASTAVPPANPGMGGLWRHGKLLVIDKRTTLPTDRCIKSNEKATRTLKRNLTWHHPAVFLALLANLLIYVILAVILSKRATIHIGLSDRWFSKRRWAMLIGWGLVFLGAAGFVGGIVMIEENPDVGPLLLLGSVILAVGGGIYGLIAARLVHPKKITDTHIFLAGAHPEFLAPLPAWPHKM